MAETAVGRMTGSRHHPDAEPDETNASGDGLSALEKRILQTEGRWFRYAGSKEALVRQELGLSGVRYYQILNGLLDRPEALQYAPIVVNRLRGRRERARRGRWRAAADGGDAR